MSRSLLASPTWTAYLNVITEVPEPLTYEARRSVIPVSTKTVGVPAEVVTATFFVNVTVISIAVPARYEPLAIDEVTPDTVGRTVSTVAVTSELAEFIFPTASLKTPATTCTDIGVVELLVGVKINEYEVPDPVNPLINPPVAETSVLVKFIVASLSDAVIVAV
jgi:hypothetical protein